MKSLEVTGKTRVLFISFGSKPVLPRSLWSRTTFLPGEMECLQAWKKIKKMKKKVLFPLSALHAFHYPRLCRLDARNVTYEGKLVKLKQNQSRPFLFQYGKKKIFPRVSYKAGAKNHGNWNLHVQRKWRIPTHFFHPVDTVACYKLLHSQPKCFGLRGGLCTIYDNHSLDVS